jgi:DNA-binding NarL/FixJ family response regulator
MVSGKIQILLIEDNPGDVRLIREMLSEVSGIVFTVLHADLLQRGVELLQSQPFDILLLDLSLPDSRGIDTLSQVLELSVGVPVIIVATDDDESLAARAVAAGAQDYLIKGQFNAAILSRAVRYALERHSLLVRLHTVQREAELSSLEQLSQRGPVSVTAQMYGAATLREALPDIFQRLVERYEQVIDQAVEQKFYKVNYALSDKVRAIADQLGFLRAGPRDVVEIHGVALKRRMAASRSTRSQVYIDEGRMLALELMGDLVSFYRNYAIGLNRALSSDAHADPSSVREQQ